MLSTGRALVRGLRSHQSANRQVLKCRAEFAVAGGLLAGCGALQTADCEGQESQLVSTALVETDVVYDAPPARKFFRNFHEYSPPINIQDDLGWIPNSCAFKTITSGIVGKTTLEQRVSPSDAVWSLLQAICWVVLSDLCCNPTSLLLPLSRCRASALYRKSPSASR